MINTVLTHPDFYIVDKPANVGFHDEKGENQGCLNQGFFNECCEHFAETLYPVHRLDKITSGLLILARNQQAAVWFQQAFENKHINKLYLALAKSKPKKKQGSIIGDMTKSRNSQWKLLKSKNNPATTRFFSWGLEHEEIPGLRLFLLKPETGKTHQIRVAMKSLGSPIFGDNLYGGHDADRGYLHAYGLKFQYQEQLIELYQLPTIGTWFNRFSPVIAEHCGSGFNNNWPGSTSR